MSRPPFITLHLTSPRQEHETVSWLQQLINERGEKFVVPPLEVDGLFGATTAAETEEFLYRLGHPDPIPAIGPSTLAILWKWSQGERFPTDWQMRRLARMATGFRRGWGITRRSWETLHPGQFGDKGELYDPADAADVMLGWEEDGYKESPTGSNIVPALVKLGQAHFCKPVFSSMGYAWCAYATYLSGLIEGGKTARAGLVYGAFWPLYTPTILAMANAGTFGHVKVFPGAARKGDMVLFNFGAREPVQHVGRLIERSATRVISVDGNTSTTSQDNGGAVMVRDRPASTVVAYVRDA